MTPLYAMVVVVEADFEEIGREAVEAALGTKGGEPDPPIAVWVGQGGPLPKEWVAPSELKTFILHATCEYVVKSKETGETEAGTNRPTISVEAVDQAEAEEKAKAEQIEKIGTEWWPVVSLTLSVAEVTVLD